MTQPKHVLVIEDDTKISQLLIDYLHNEGFSVSAIENGHEALIEFQRTPPSLVILDLMLPGMDGISVCRAIRQSSDVPILMLTARVEEVDRLLGLNTGADDYVCKPFSPREVIARVGALLRRSEGRLKAAPPAWVIDDQGLKISLHDQRLPLTPLEFRMLRLLLSQPGRVFSRAQLLDIAHSELRDVSDRAIDSHIKNVRRKIQAIHPDSNCIASVYGVGYRFDSPE